MAIEKTVLMSVILSQRKHFSNKNLIQRDKFETVLSAAKTPFIQVIIGIRRAGKSALLNQLRANKKADNYFINFDDNRLYNFEIEDFETLHEVFFELYGEENVFYLDEIQNIDGWEKYVRRLYEEGKKIFITGSNAKMLSEDLGIQPTDISIQTELFPFSFTEFLRWKKIKWIPDDLYDPVKSAQIKTAYKAYVISGGLPDFLQTQNSDFLKSLFNDIVYRDIIARYSIRQEKNLIELLHFLVSNATKAYSYNKLKDLFGFSNAITVKKYITFFEQSYLLFSVSKFDFSLSKQLNNPKKIYVIDTGLANSISFHFSENTGQQLENMVFLQLKRLGLEIFYHRNSYDCDFVVRENEVITAAIQVSMSLFDPKTKAQELRGLLEAMLTHKLSKGLIISYDEEENIEMKGLTIVVKPIWKWLLLADKSEFSG